MTARISRREMFARILLAADPSDLGDMGDNKLSVEFDTVAAARAFIKAAGLDGRGDHFSGYPVSINDTHRDGIARQHFGAYPDWHGWHLYVMASEPIGVATLDDATRAQLQAVAAGKPGTPC